MIKHIISNTSSLGQLIRSERERKNLSQKEVAFAAGVGTRFISDLENGKTTCQIEKTLRITELLGITLSAETDV